MRVTNKIWILVLIAFTMLSQNTVSQRIARQGSQKILSGLTLTPKAGVNVFFGDLVDSSRENYSLGITVDREMLEYLTLRASLMGGQMKGKQIFSSLNEPYATFENFYVDFTVGGTYKPLNQTLGYFKERTLQPYLLFQTGLVYYNSTEYWGKASETTVGSDGPGEVWRTANGVAALVSGGGGLNIWINPNLSLNVEVHGNLAFTDKLDAHDIWRDSYPNGAIHTTDPYDFYYIGTLGVIYTVKNGTLRNHPKFNRKSYLKTRKFYAPSKRRVTKHKPNRRNSKRFLFF